RVCQVDAVDLDLGRLLVEKVVQFLLGELVNRFVRIEIATAPVYPAIPAIHAVAGDRDRTLVERLTVVVERREVDVGNRAPALAFRAHAPRDPEAAPLLDGLPALLAA